MRRKDAGGGVRDRRKGQTEWTDGMDRRKRTDGKGQKEKGRRNGQKEKGRRKEKAGAEGARRGNTGAPYCLPVPVFRCRYEMKERMLSSRISTRRIRASILVQPMWGERMSFEGSLTPER